MLKFIKLLLLVLLLNPRFGHCDKVDDLASRLDIERAVAEQIITSLFSVVRGVQSGIAKIADNSIPINDKIGEGQMIDAILNEFFEQSNSKIYVSSLNKSPSLVFGARSYFTRLASLTKTNRYDTVRIYFDEKLKLTNIYKENGKFYVSADFWQIFKGCGSNYENIERCYEDVTKKTINISINSFNLTPRVQEILVGDTLTYNAAKKEIDLDLLDFNSL